MKLLNREAREIEWLLIEWPSGEDEPTKYWLSTLPEDSKIEDLVDLAKLRWRIERDYQDLKQEIGLGHYEGRGWRGFHHHATLACGTGDCGLWVPHLQSGCHFPLSRINRQTLMQQAPYPTKNASNSRRFPTSRRCRCGLNVTSQHHSQP